MPRAIPIEEEVIVVAGTGYLGGGADSAAVVKPSVLPETFFLNIEKGLEIREIIAMPRVKFSQRLVTLLKTRAESV